MAVVAALLAAAAPLSAVAQDAADPDPRGRVVVEAAPSGDAEAQATARVAAMTPREKAAAVVMGHIPSADAGTVRSYMESSGLGGFILMGANIPATEAELQVITAAMTVDPSLPPLIAVDQEGGDVTRLPWDGFPSARVLKDQPPEATRDAFAARGALVQRAGIGVNFGIVADVASDAGSFIFRRALGTDARSGAEHVAGAVDGEAGSAMSTLKHFPGHGAAPGDSHVGIPSTGMSKQQWAETDGAPFLAGIDAGAELLMYGHLAYTAVDTAPASLSAEWHRIARDEFGFDGVSITDDLGMLQASGDPAYADPVANAVTALRAGNDMVLAVMFSTAESAPRIIDGIVAAVESGALPAERLDDAAERVTALRVELGSAGRGLVPCADCAPVG